MTAKCISLGQTAPSVFVNRDSSLAKLETTKPRLWSLMKFSATISKCSIHERLNAMLTDVKNICLRFGSNWALKGLRWSREQIVSYIYTENNYFIQRSKGLFSFINKDWTRHANSSVRVTVYLTHSLIPLASCTDLGVGDVEVPSVHLSTPLITDNRQVDYLQCVIVAGAWKSLRLHFKASVLL